MIFVGGQDDWAVASNDKSPNENHHLASGFRVRACVCVRACVSVRE